MREVLVDELDGPIDDRPVAGINPRRSERLQPLERREVVGEIAAAPLGNHHRRAGDQHVAGEQRARRRMPEARMILGVAGRMQGHELVVAGADDVAVVETAPAADHAAGPLADLDRRPARRERRDRRRVIEVAVRHQHARERPAAERGGDRVEMLRRANAGVHERGLGAVDQPRVVAGAGQGARVCRGEENGLHRTISLSDYRLSDHRPIDHRFIGLSIIGSSSSQVDADDLDDR